MCCRVDIVYSIYCFKCNNELVSHFAPSNLCISSF